jgi:hypothetical protein
MLNGTRLAKAKRELERFEATLIGIESDADRDMLRRLRANVARFMQDVAWCKRKVRDRAAVD